MQLMFLLLTAVITATVVNASTLNLDIYYPESGLISEAISNLDGNIFSVGYSSLPYSLDLANQYNAMDMYYFPWFGDYTLFVNNETHYVGANHWRVSISLDDFVGDLYVELSSNFYGNTVSACELQYSYGTCQPRSSPYYVNVASSADSVDLVMYPAFSTTGVGRTYTVFTDYYSETLGNYRDINVYVPWSLIENPLQRSVNAVVYLDGDLDGVTLMSLNGGR
jgi:hypothetical protein